MGSLQGRQRRGDTGRLGSHIPKVAAVVLCSLALVACSSTGGKPRDTGSAGGAGGGVDTPRITIAMITHEAPGDSFWDLVRKGAETAAKKDNIELRYSGDPEGPNQANFVQTAVDSGVKGIAVTLAKPDAMKPGVEAATAKGIPVVAFNAGLSDWRAMGVKEYFGQDGYIAGQEAGKRLSSEGAKKVICVIQEQGHVDLEARCAGMKNTFPATEVLNVNGKDMPSVEATITAKLQQDPAIDYVVALGAPFAMTAVQSVKNAGSSAKIGTFDTNSALVDAIQGGDVQWAVDQQPFLQGYLAVDSLWLYLNNGNVIGGNQATLTGPSFIDKTNIDAVAAYAKAGTR
jgi:simple sugar transport system substrate-binding protein